MSARKHALKDMTFVEFAERMADRPVILLPLGSQEEQGPHAPMGDYVVAERLALMAAARADAICAPVLPFGYADFFRGTPGGVQLRAETFTAVLADMVTAFLDHGLEHLVICNGHSTNAPLIAQVAHKIRRERGVAIASVNLWRAMPDEVWRDVHGDNAGRARGHGADPLTSVYLHLAPELMRPDLIRQSDRAPAFGLATSAQFSSVIFEGGAVDLPLDASEVADNGVGGGDPGLATAEIGRQMSDWIVDWLARFVEHFGRCDPRAPGRAPQAPA